ncbi:hypothetical protein ACS0TY_016250 [Phlomoides rotata]
MLMEEQLGHRAFSQVVGSFVITLGYLELITRDGKIFEWNVILFTWCSFLGQRTILCLGGCLLSDTMPDSRFGILNWSFHTSTGRATPQRIRSRGRGCNRKNGGLKRRTFCYLFSGKTLMRIFIVLLDSL